jgi:uroporphyrinogen decarboxylase
MGGLNRMDITRGDRSKILQQIDYIFTRCPHNCQIITPGCVIRYPLNDDILRFIKDEIDSRNRERA